MKLRQKKETEMPEQLGLPEREGVGKGKGSKKKKPESVGSRWAAVVLLIITLVLGIWFYIQGTGGFQAFSQGLGSIFSGWGGQSTYVFEK